MTKINVMTEKAVKFAKFFPVTLLLMSAIYGGLGYILWIHYGSAAVPQTFKMPLIFSLVAITVLFEGLSRIAQKKRFWNLCYALGLSRSLSAILGVFWVFFLEYKVIIFIFHGAAYQVLFSGVVILLFRINLLSEKGLLAYVIVVALGIITVSILMYDTTSLSIELPLFNIFCLAVTGWLLHCSVYAIHCIIHSHPETESVALYRSSFSFWFKA